jgi:hypothetical protein
MKVRGKSRNRRLRRRAALRLALLMLPALFWSCVFAALAGVRPLGGAFGSVPDAAQLFVLAGCPLLAAALGVRAVARGKAGRGRCHGLCRLTVAAGVALSLLAVLLLKGGVPPERFVIGREKSFPHGETKLRLDPRA